jgi:hypothetical protein
MESQELDGGAKDEMNGPLVPKAFAVPTRLETAEFSLRMLTVHDVVKDYDAVMTSVDHLHGLFGTESHWPHNLTLEQDLIDLGWHQKEFQRRSSFAYTVMTLDESKCLGCIYIYPANDERHDAEVFLWARQSELANGLEQRIFEKVKAWLASVWPFKSVSFPGRNQQTRL